MPESTLTSSSAETPWSVRAARALADFFRLPREGASAKGWHVAPAVDLSAYAFGWAWVLVPLVLLGPRTEDYLFVYLVVLGVTGVHRHFGLPYVYLDGQVRRSYPLRFTLVPAALFAAWVASPWLAEQAIALSLPDVAAVVALTVLLAQVLRKDGGADAPPRARLALATVPPLTAALALHVFSPLDPAWGWLGAALFASAGVALASRRSSRLATNVPVAPLLVLALVAAAILCQRRADAAGGGFPINVVLDVVAIVAFLWNVWHVYMQKYGIFRMYSAKSEGAEKVSPFKDRLFVLAWLPLYVAWIGPHYKDVALEQLGGDDGILARVIDLMIAIEPVSVPIGFATVLLAIVLWVSAEWRASRLRNTPRLAMALGTTGLAASFLLVDPIKAYLAFGFSHAVEYMVFVWAFQRRRYAQPLAHAPLLATILRRPFLAYGGFIVVVGAVFLGTKYLGTYILPDIDQPEVLGYRTVVWAKYWGIYQSMAHFYFDGFLWKMRLPSVRGTI